MVKIAESRKVAKAATALSPGVKIQVGEPYTEVGIEHVEMILKL